MKKIVLLAICLMVTAGLLVGCSHKDAALRKDRAEAARNLGEAYMAEGNYTKALRELLKAEQMNPADSFLQNDLGLTYMAKDDPRQAVDHFKKALKINPDYSPALNNLGTAYIALEQWDQAIECFTGVADDLLYATPYYPLTNLGYVHYKQGRYEMAERYYKEALELKSDFTKAVQGLGQVYMASGEYEKAIDKFERAVELAPKAARLHLDLGRAYEKYHDYHKAVNAYKKAAAIAAGTALADEAESAARALQQSW